MTDATTEIVTYSATDTTDKVLLTSTVAVTFGTPKVLPTLADSVIDASATTAPADGQTAVTIAVFLYDANGDPVSAKAVSLNPTGGHSVVDTVTGSTDQGGQATFSVTDTTPETVTYDATDSTDELPLTGLSVQVVFTVATSSATGTGSSSTTSTTTTTRDHSVGLVEHRGRQLERRFRYFEQRHRVFRDVGQYRLGRFRVNGCARVHRGSVDAAVDPGLRVRAACLRDARPAACEARMSRAPGMWPSLLHRALVVLGGGIVILATVLMLFGSRAGAATPAVTITPQSGASSGSGYRSGEAVDVSVGANSLFKPNLRVNILECADPGGTTANLPTSVEDCDGNTIQGDTVLVQPDGSIDEKQYTIYSVPNQILGEEPDWLPVCDSSHECVLYVGENQEDFTQPKLFSAPFTVSPSTGSTGDSGSTSATTATSTASVSAGSSATASTTSPGESGTLQPGSSDAAGGDPSTSTGLADTGFSPAHWWMVAVGAALTLAGALGRRASTVPK